MYRHVSSRELAKPKTYLLGVDLGQTQDYTAITVLECNEVKTGKTRERPDLIVHSYSFRGTGRLLSRPQPMPIEDITENHYAARHLERLPIGTPYPVQVARVKALHDQLKVQEGKRHYSWSIRPAWADQL